GRREATWSPTRAVASTSVCSAARTSGRRESTAAGKPVAGVAGARRGRRAKAGRRATRGTKKAGKRGRPAKGASKGTAAKGKAKSARGGAKGGKVPAKYRGPNGEAWSGRGKQPRWLAALVAEGRSPSEYLI
ncbi:MAG: H-NS family nucleoid-associated regulatory protein, partial [Gemmatimonadaceae bacterium]